MINNIFRLFSIIRRRNHGIDYRKPTTRFGNRINRKVQRSKAQVLLLAIVLSLLLFGSMISSITYKAYADCIDTPNTPGCPFQFPPKIMQKNTNGTITKTFSDEPGKLIVIVKVVNDDGGTARPSQFMVHIASQQCNQCGVVPRNLPGVDEPGQVVRVIGQYAVTEIPNSDYTRAFSPVYGNYAHLVSNNYGDGCFGTIAFNQIKTCTVYNDDKPTSHSSPSLFAGLGAMGRLLVVNRVINDDDGGIARPSDFRIHIAGSNVVPPNEFLGSSSGIIVSLRPGTYAVYEIQNSLLARYSTTESNDCLADIHSGEVKQCNVYNDDRPQH